MAPPASVLELVESWRRDGSPQRHPFEWNKASWQSLFPEYRELWDNGPGQIPSLIDRAWLKRFCARQLHDSQVDSAFMAVMIWGYGKTGYGPYRTRRIMKSDPHAIPHLAAVANALAERGPVAAYEALSGAHRVKYLGPAFGTKLLTSWPQPRRQPQGLILDSVIADWLRGHTKFDFRQTAWRPLEYAEYLSVMYEWAADRRIGVSAVLLEEIIFRG